MKEKDSRCKWKQKKARVTLIPGRTDFKTKAITEDRKPLHSDKGINPKEDITFIKILVPNTRVPKYIK